MKKIVFFSHGLSANGIETFLFNVLGGLNKEKFDVTVIIAIDPDVSQVHEEQVKTMGVKVLRAGDMNGLRKKWAFVRNVNRFLRAERYDVVHANMDMLNGIVLFLAKRNKIPVRICHAHNSKSQYQPVGRFAFLKSVAQKLYVRTMKHSILRNSTIRLSCSEVAAQYFYGDKSSEMIYNGVELEKFRMPESFDRDAYARDLGCIQTPHRIISVGRVSMQKNPMFALEIADRLRRIRQDFQYIWLGCGKMDGAVRERIAALDLQEYVLVLGVRMDVPQVLNVCDCFLMPSLFEGLPFSLVEAQAAGLPCVVSDVVTTQADVGLVKYLPLNAGAEKWAQAIDRIWNGKRKTANPEKMKLFDIRQTIARLEQIYDV